MFKWLTKILPHRRSLENPSVPTNFPFWWGKPTLAGVSVDEHSAMRYATVYACVNRLSSDLASLKFGVYSHGPEGKFPAPDHPVDRLIRHSPDGIRPAYKFWQTSASHLLRWGNSFIEIIRNEETGRPIKLKLLPPDRIYVDFVDDDKVMYELRGTRHDHRIHPFNMLHFAGLGYDGLVGYSPISMARESIGLGISADLSMSSFYGLSTKPSGYLSHPGKLSETAAKTLREEWEMLHAGPMNAGRTAVLQEGMTWNPFSLPGPDTNFLQSRQWQPEEICRWFLVPPPKAGIYDHATYSNLEQANLDYLSSVIPWANSFTGEMHHKLFLGSERGRFFVKPHYNELLKADSAAINSKIAVGRQWGTLNVDECRDFDDLNPLPDGLGKTYLSPANMITAEQSKIQTTLPPPATPAAAAPPTTPPGTDQQPSNSAIVSASRAVLAAELDRSLRREIKSVRSAAKKPTEFAPWLSDFYGNHHSYLADAIDLALNAYCVATGCERDARILAEQWTTESERELRDLAAAISATDLQAAVDDLTDRWGKRIDKAIDYIGA